MMLGVLIFATIQLRVNCLLAQEHESYTTTRVMNHLIESERWARRLQSTDWTVNDPPSYTPTMHDIAMSSDGQIQVALDEVQTSEAPSGNIWKSTGYGSTWNSVGTSGLEWFAVAMSDDGKQIPSRGCRRTERRVPLYAE